MYKHTVIPTCFVKDLSSLSQSSLGGLIAILIAMVVTLVYIGSTNEVYISTTSLPHDTQFIGPNPFIPASLLFYQFTMHSLFPSLRSSMARPAEAPQMTKLVLGIIAALVIVFSTVIYAILGSDVPEMITAELGTSSIGVMVNILVILSAYGKVPLSIISLADAASELYIRKPPKNSTPSSTPGGGGGSSHVGVVRFNGSSTLVRVEVLLFTLLSCVFVTGYMAWVQFICWIFTPTLVVILPIMCYLNLFNKHEVSTTSRVFYKGVIITCIVMCVIGVEANCASILDL
jgi:amino acid permease